MTLQLLKMVVNQKRNACVTSVHLKFGVALAFSAGGIIYAFLAIKRSKRSENVDNNGSNPSSGNENKSDARGENNGDEELRQQDIALLDSTIRRVLSHGSLSDRSSFGSRDGLLLPEFNEVLQECSMALTTAAISPRKSDGHGVGDLGGFGMNLYPREGRDANLELQPLECCGNKEMEHLHNSDYPLYDLKIESLVSHNRRLETKLGDYGRLMAELEDEKTKTKILRRKLRAGAEQADEDILTPTDHDLIRKELEEHLEEMMKSNRSLKQENSELRHKLDYVQMLATSALETEEMHELRVESQRLRQQNEELMKEVERIQAERWSDIEELVYLRWINACLRYEVRNNKPGAGKSIPGEAMKMLNPKSEDRVKQIIMESAYKDISMDRRMDITDLDSDHGSSLYSCFTDSGERDDSSVDTNVADKPHRSGKNKVFSKLRKLLKGKGSSNNNQEAAAKKSKTIGRTVSLINIPDGYSSYSDDLRNSSRGSSRRSLDLPRSCSRSQKSMSSNGSTRMSDVSSSVLTRINSLTEADEHEWPQLEPALPSQDAKEELLKYAETLKNSRRVAQVCRNSQELP